MSFTSEQVERAAERIAGRVRRTPIVQVDAQTWFKCEFLQHTGTFKARGAINRVLGALESGELDRSIGVACASGGNAGLAVAHAAREVGIPANVFVPETAPAVKVARLRSLGARVEQIGSEYAEAYDAATKFAAETGATFCHAYDQPNMVAGAGTLALEIFEDLDRVDTIVVAVGGGGLMAGVAAAAEGRARVIAVEPETAPTLRSALDHGKPIDVPVSGVAVDSLGARRLGDIAFEVATRTKVTSVLVSDQDLIDARQWLWAQWRIGVEHGAAAAMAALAGGAYRPEPGERVMVVLCGANTDPSTLA